jgi:hypothetical protein
MTEPAVNVMTQDLTNEGISTLDEYTAKTVQQMRAIPEFPADELKVSAPDLAPIFFVVLS